MNLLVSMVPRDLPRFIRRAIVLELFAATAAGFARPQPALDQLSCEACLRVYAGFTKAEAEKALQSGQDIAALKAALYESAYPLGASVRKWFRISSLETVMATAQILYRALGIDLEGDSQGEVTVRSCYFSQFYSAPVCDLISALDDGLFSGLSGGRRLAFGQRLTEGKACCRAKLLARSG